MSFYNQIDKNHTIKKAKEVLKEYTKFLKMLNCACYDIGIKSKADMNPLGKVSYVNSDAALIAAIENKDRNYKELAVYINHIQSSINNLELWEIELINMKYVQGLSFSEIKDKLSERYTERQIKRKYRECYIDFAISYGVYIMKETDVPVSGTKGN